MKRTSIYLIGLFLIIFSSSTVTSLQAQEATDTVRVVEAPAVDDSAYVEQDEEQATTENDVYDTALLVNPWHYPADSLKRIQRQSDFKYVSNLDSLLKKWQEENLKKQQPIEPVETESSGDGLPFLRFLLWGIAIAVLLFVIYRLFLSEAGLFAAPTRNKSLTIAEEEVTDEGYLERQLKEAIRAANYRLAIRYLYLQSLSKLADKGWLELSPDKTNYQYVRELKKPLLKNDFARITLHYEYAWYGDFQIEADLFQPVKNDFDQFQTKIKQG